MQNAFGQVLDLSDRQKQLSQPTQVANAMGFFYFK
jgi:hypothetical protein